ncbi:MAG: hypothetical protein NTU88_15780, partial [Armatimonadetes bacterium]|nr:hypothetical protein [Armatimonadota bacterium]
TLVDDIEDSAECAVVMLPGTIRYLEEDIALSVVGAVTTSRIARKQGLAGRLTAAAIARDAADGALVSGLGMFEQGYYDRLGFGTGSYVHGVSFDPADLLVDVKPRVPRRITKDDWEAVHASRLARLRGHGAVNVLSPLVTRGEMIGDKDAFGLGYYDGPNGELTHHLGIKPKGGEHGPYNVKVAIWQTGEQFLELMAVLKSIGDQVHLVRMDEPPGIQLQDLLRQPIKKRNITKGSEFEVTIKAGAFWQARILDLPGCMAQTHLPRGEVRFNLRLTDPMETLLDDASPWHGIGGDYVVALGPESSAVRGADASLRTLSASVGAFTRMWLGVQPATGLAITDRLSGLPDLLRALDHSLRLTTPYQGWDI